MNSSATDVVRFDNRDERFDFRNVRGDGRAGEAAQDVHEPRPEAQEKKEGRNKKNPKVFLFTKERNIPVFVTCLIFRNTSDTRIDGHIAVRIALHDGGTGHGLLQPLAEGGVLVRRPQRRGQHVADGRERGCLAPLPVVEHIAKLTEKPLCPSIQ